MKDTVWTGLSGTRCRIRSMEDRQTGSVGGDRQNDTGHVRKRTVTQTRRNRTQYERMKWDLRTGLTGKDRKRIKQNERTCQKWTVQEMKDKLMSTGHKKWDYRTGKGRTSD